MLRAVPATMDMADSVVKQLRSGIFTSAISLTWSHEMVATLSRFGSFEPF